MALTLRGKRWRGVWRSAVWVALVLLLLVVVAVAYVRWVFDPNSLKPQIARWVQANYQRQLTVTGDVELKWWPRAHLALSGVALSEPNSTVAFASLRRGLLTLRLAPLLRKQVVVEALTLEGLSLQVQRAADGRWSIEDLLRSEGESSLQIDIAALVLREAKVTVRDVVSGRRWHAGNVQLTAGPLALAKPGELSAGFELAEEAASVRGKVSLAARFLVRAQPFALEVNRIDARVSGQAADIAIEHAQIGMDAAQLTGGRWVLREVSVSARGTRAAERLALDLASPQATYAAERWGATGVRAHLTRELAQVKGQILTKQDLDLSLATLQGSAEEVTAPASKLKFALQDAIGHWSGHLLGAATYRVQERDWRLTKAELDATWRRDAQMRLRLSGSGEISALPIQGVWRAEDFAVNLTGALPVGQIEARARASAHADVPAQSFSVSLAGLQLALRKQTLLLEAKSSAPVSVRLVNDSLVGTVTALPLRLSDTDLDVSGTLEAAVSGTPSRANFALQPLTLNLAGKFAGDRVKAGLRGDASIEADAQQLSISKLQVHAQIDRASSSQTHVQNLDSHGTLSAHWGRQHMRYETTGTAVSIRSLVRSNQSNKGYLSGVVDLAWDKQTASFAGRGKFDASNIKGRVAWTGGAAQAAYDFDLDVDALDWDRYAPSPARAGAAPKQAQQLDLDQLRKLRIKGVARIGILKARGVSARNVTLDLQ